MTKPMALKSATVCNGSAAPTKTPNSIGRQFIKSRLFASNLWPSRHALRPIPLSHAVGRIVSTHVDMFLPVGVHHWDERMRNLRVLLSVAALANFFVVVWHTYLAAKVNPALPFALAVWIVVISGALTLGGLVLLWTRRQNTGALGLIAVFVIGLLIGSAEHFFVAGPNNVFDVRGGDWALSFKFSVWVLLLLQVAGLSVAGRMLAARSSGELTGSPRISR